MWKVQGEFKLWLLPAVATWAGSGQDWNLATSGGKTTLKQTRLFYASGKEDRVKRDLWISGSISLLYRHWHSRLLSWIFNYTTQSRKGFCSHCSSFTAVPPLNFFNDSDLSSNRQPITISGHLNSSFDLMPTQIAEITFPSLVFILSMCAGRAVSSHLRFPMAVLNKPGYFKLFLQEMFFISLTTLTGFFSPFSHFSSLVLDRDGDICAPVPAAVPHGLRQQLERSLLCHRKHLFFCTTAWCWSPPWILLHWELEVTWCLACCLQGDELLSRSIHF